MTQISIVPQLIQQNHIKFFDEFEMPISICKKPIEISDINFVKPFLIIDTYEAMNYKYVEVKTLELPELDRLGYRLVSISLKGMSGSRRNYVGQLKAYVFRKKTDPLGRDLELNKLPKDHQLEMDIINGRIRIKGRDAVPKIPNEQASKWIDVRVELKKHERGR